MGTLIQRKNGTIIYFDTAKTVVKDLPSRITSHPIEEGSTITDHVVTDPRKITVDGVISDAAFILKEDDPFSEVRDVEVVNSTLRRRVPIEGRSLKALAELESIRDNREVFIIQTRNEIFESMVFTSFNVPRDKDTGDATRIQFTAQQIETVQRRFATVPQAVAEEDADKASENAETGKQQTSSADVSAISDALQFFADMNNPSLADIKEAL